MASPTRTARPVRLAVGLFGISGALVILGILGYFVRPALAPWLFLAAALVLATAWVLLGSSGSVGGGGRFASAAAAIGWLLVALASLLPGVLGLVGEFVAAVGGLVAGILAFRTRLFGRPASLLFLLATIAMAVYLAKDLLPAAVAVIAAVLYAAGLLITALVVLLRESR